MMPLLHDLPSEVLLRSLVHIHPHALVRLSATSRSFHALLTSPLGLTFTTENLLMYLMASGASSFINSLASTLRRKCEPHTCPEFSPLSVSVFPLLEKLDWWHLGVEYVAAMFVLTGFTHSSLRLVDREFVTVVHNSPKRLDTIEFVGRGLEKALKWSENWAKGSRDWRTCGRYSLDISMDDHFALRWAATTDRKDSFHHLLQLSATPFPYSPRLFTNSTPSIQTPAITEAFLLAVYDDSPSVVSYLLDSNIILLDDFDGEAHLCAAQSGSIGVLKVFLEHHRRRTASSESIKVDTTSAQTYSEPSSSTPLPRTTTRPTSPSFDPSSPKGVEVLQAAARNAYLHEEQIEVLKIVAMLAGWDEMGDDTSSDGKASRSWSDVTDATTIVGSNYDNQDDPAALTKIGDSAHVDSGVDGWGHFSSERQLRSEYNSIHSSSSWADTPSQPTPPSISSSTDPSTDPSTDLANLLLQESAHTGNALAVLHILNTHITHHPLSTLSLSRPIQIAAALGHLDVVRILVRRGGRPENGIEEAVQGGWWEVMWYLVGVMAAREGRVRRTVRDGSQMDSGVSHHTPAPVVTIPASKLFLFAHRPSFQTLSNLLVSTFSVWFRNFSGWKERKTVGSWWGAVLKWGRRGRRGYF
ncbi:hypothetical protein BC829DRAFT_384503 [Chytridium lagenaria]|nr:hypothetical protein BC829DRAFT_384503 [Chytridium lagenaria]